MRQGTVGVALVPQARDRVRCCRRSRPNVFGGFGGSVWRFGVPSDLRRSSALRPACAFTTAPRSARIAVRTPACAFDLVPVAHVRVRDERRAAKPPRRVWRLWRLGLALWRSIRSAAVLRLTPRLRVHDCTAKRPHRRAHACVRVRYERRAAKPAKRVWRLWRLGLALWRSIRSAAVLRLTHGCVRTKQRWSA
jgi:hypothetical protein